LDPCEFRQRSPARPQVGDSRRRIGNALTDLSTALAKIAGSDKCTTQAQNIAAAIQYTYSKNATWGFLGLGRLREAIGSSQRECGYFCHEWAFAFATAAKHEATNDCFTIEVQQASTRDTSGRVHYWIKITSAHDSTNFIYVDDGFAGGYVHKTQPLPAGYLYDPGILDHTPGSEECKPPPAYDSKGTKLPSK
jgi:hypothetical protein